MQPVKIYTARTLPTRASLRQCSNVLLLIPAVECDRNNLSNVPTVVVTELIYIRNVVLIDQY